MMRRPGFSKVGAILLGGGVALGIVALTGEIGLSGENDIRSAPPVFQPGIAKHESWTESHMPPELAPISEIPAQTEIEMPPPTRSSFMGSWPSVSGARGYLLDVSTSDSFTSYVEGYHDLDVGNVTGRVVTGLNR